MEPHLIEIHELPDDGANSTEECDRENPPLSGLLILRIRDRKANHGWKQLNKIAYPDVGE
jgi:hypothetical protein